MRKLWNRPDDAVWSLSTLSADGVPNMNICTYVSAISLDPKLLMVAVYHGTQTRTNIAVGGTVLLQLLSQELAPVVRVCGQMSGKTINKIARLQKRYDIQQVDGFSYFKAAAGYMTLEIEQIIKTSGDHDLLISKVIKAKNLADVPLLTTTYLKAEKYIR